MISQLVDVTAIVQQVSQIRNCNPVVAQWVCNGHLVWASALLKCGQNDSLVGTPEFVGLCPGCRAPTILKWSFRSANTDPGIGRSFGACISPASISPA